MLRPLFQYGKGAVTHVNVTSNVLTVTVPNSLAAGQVTGVSVVTATFLNGVSFTVATASGTQWTATFTHANYDAADTGTGGGQSVLPTYPPVNKPLVDAIAEVANDVYTLSGKEESVLIRQDRTRTVQFDAIPVADIPMWEAFFLYACQRKVFTVYDDATTLAGGIDYTTTDKFSPAFAFRGHVKLTFNIRRYVA